MKAVQIVNHDGPEAALRVATEADQSDHMAEMFPNDRSVEIEVHVASVSFPELLQTKGMYQYQPELPFIPGSEVAGRVVRAHPDSGFEVGDRVGAFCGTGGWSEKVDAPESLTFKLPSFMSYAEGASFLLNYHTAYFALRIRGSLEVGDAVLIHGASGGLGSAAVELVTALGGEAIAVVSSDEKAQFATERGAVHALSVDDWKTQLDALYPDGVSMVLDLVGASVTADSLRALKPMGQYIVLGFAGGAIPEIKVNRLLLRNISVIGAGWGAYAFERPEINRKIQQALEPLLLNGSLKPYVGGEYQLEDATQALLSLQERSAIGKVVLRVR